MSNLGTPLWGSNIVLFEVNTIQVQGIQDQGSVFLQIHELVTSETLVSLARFYNYEISWEEVQCLGQISCDANGNPGTERSQQQTK